VQVWQVSYNCNVSPFAFTFFNKTHAHLLKKREEREKIQNSKALKHTAALKNKHIPKLRGTKTE